MSATRTAGRLGVIGAAAIAATLSARAQEGFTFKSGVDLVNVTATVTGADGRFVSGLTKDDFIVYDDGQPQAITHFSSERVPVSLGIALDASGSMTEDKMAKARAAIGRFVTDLLEPDDELFFVEFADDVFVRQDWTTDRRTITRAVGRVEIGGGTALYDAIAESLPIAASGQHRKKALLVISDGNDSDSSITPFELRQAIRESEVLVYALGVDGTAATGGSRSRPRTTPPSPPQVPPTGPRFPIPIPGRPPTFPFPQIGLGQRLPAARGERVNADALRQITDDTGGRTEIIRDFDSLDAATARIADELSRQYSLGYPSPRDRDGRWHSIRIEVKDRNLTVRARRGYVS
jgi:VWFA-related protein